MLKLSGTIINENLVNLTSEKRVNAIVVDDSFYGKQAISKAPDVMIQMLEAAVKAAIPAKHVLFDSWFSYPVTIIKIFNIKIHTVGRLKNTTRIKYIFEGEKNLSLNFFDLHFLLNSRKCQRFFC